MHSTSPAFRLTPPRLAESTERSVCCKSSRATRSVSHPLDSRRVLKGYIYRWWAVFWRVSHPLDSRRVLKEGVLLIIHQDLWTVSHPLDSRRVLKGFYDWGITETSGLTPPRLAESTEREGEKQQLTLEEVLSHTPSTRGEY